MVGNDFVFLHVATGGVKHINLSKGLRIKAVIGGGFEAGRVWQAIPGITYGFLVEKK